MSSLALPRPENLRGAPGVLIESDVFHICDQLKELDKNLYVYALDPPIEIPGHTYCFAVCERCSDGVERLVKRFESLDGRIIKELQYMLGVPFEQRFKEAERLEAAAQAEREEAEKTELYERMGRPMLTDLERCGFIQRPTSYAKRGVTGGRGSKRSAAR